MMNKSEQIEVLEHIRAALEAARVVLERFTPGAIEAEYKVGHDPVTEADRQVDTLLRQHLLRKGDGWLSEETLDDPSRLEKHLVWVVDPLDGTREFVAGIPEFCVSVALVEDGRPMAGGILNPATDELFLGALDTGVTLNGKPVHPTDRMSLNGALVLASRSEVKRGEWKPFESTGVKIQNMGSVAYKLARVSAGLADVTFTLVPKNEWDVAAGAALVVSGGGFLSTLENRPLRCNNRNTLLTGLIASGPNLRGELLTMLRDHMQPAAVSSSPAE